METSTQQKQLTVGDLTLSAIIILSNLDSCKRAIRYKCPLKNTFKLIGRSVLAHGSCIASGTATMNREYFKPFGGKRFRRYRQRENGDTSGLAERSYDAMRLAKG